MANGRLWTEEEDLYLEDSVGKMKIQTIAKNLNRSVSAVESRMSRKGIDNTIFHSGRITSYELAKACNVDSHTVLYWINKCELPYKKKATRFKAKFNLIDVSSFWKWAENNKDIINFTKIDKLALLPEPVWVDVERKKDYFTIPKRHAANWTETEEKQLIQLFKKGCSKSVISKELKRSENSIQRKISRLKEQGLLEKDKVMLRWTDEELRIMVELEKQGLSDDEIAYELGREANHIRDKRRRMKRKK